MTRKIPHAAKVASGQRGNRMSLGKNPTIAQSDAIKEILADGAINLEQPITGAEVVPEPLGLTVTEGEISAWYKLAAKLKEVKGLEIVARKRIFGFFFTDPKEGTNKHPLENNYVLVGKYGLNREVDKGAMTSLLPKMRELGVNTDSLFTVKYSLSKSVYNTLSKEQKHLVDQALLIKPGSPALEVVLPAKFKAK